MCWVPAGSERLWPDNGAIDARRTELKQKSDVRGFRTSLFLASSPPFRNRLGESGLSGLSLRFLKKSVLEQLGAFWLQHGMQPQLIDHLLKRSWRRDDSRPFFRQVKSFEFLGEIHVESS